MKSLIKITLICLALLVGGCVETPIKVQPMVTQMVSPIVVNHKLLIILNDKLDVVSQFLTSGEVTEKNDELTFTTIEGVRIKLHGIKCYIIRDFIIPPVSETTPESKSY